MNPAVHIPIEGRAVSLYKNWWAWLDNRLVDFSRFRQQRSAVAVITVGRDEARRYLLQWNANWRMFNLIGGKIDNDEGDDDSFLRTIQRELEEELGIRCPDECRVVSKLKEIKMRQFSRREGRVKQYHFGIFMADIFPGLPFNRERPNYFARWLSTGRENVFVSTAEIENLYTIAGRPISSTTRTILREMGQLHQLRRRRA